ncbi:hypothetical protein PtB15_2B154 [Puccinia triticina]|nr:hypothetical protein PtB15_2B154 [Puccinia triticina]
MPNFLIDPQDGQFMPYFERSPVSTPDQECDEPHYFDHPYTSYDSSPDSVLSPLRSRANSIALKKLMETQMQMLLDISAAWKKKYPCYPARVLSPRQPYLHEIQLILIPAGPSRVTQTSPEEEHIKEPSPPLPAPGD